MLYHYRAEVVRVVDGDTVVMDVDLGFSIKRREKLRLKYINAPELSTDAGPAAKDFLAGILAGKEIEIETTKDALDKYGRMLAVIWASEPGKSQVNVNQAMLDTGHATRY